MDPGHLSPLHRTQPSAVLQAVLANFVEQCGAGYTENEGSPALVAVGMAQNQRKVAPLCRLERVRLAHAGPGQRLQQGISVYLCLLQIHQHRIHLAIQLGGRAASAVGSKRGITPSSQQRDELLPEVGVTVQHQNGHGFHVEKDSSHKKRNGRLVVARRPSPAWTTQGRGITAAVLLSPATGWLIRRSGGHGEALASIPRPDGHPTWFVYGSAASQIGSRTDLSHCTPRRQIGADEARDWLHLFKPG